MENLDQFERNDVLNELEALELEFAALGFSDFDLDDSEAFNAFSAELSVAGFSNDELKDVSVNALVEDTLDVAWFLGSIKRKVRQLLEKLVGLVRRYGSRCQRAVELTTTALRQYREGKWWSALKTAYRALKAFKSCVV